MDSVVDGRIVLMRSVYAVMMAEVRYFMEHGCVRPRPVTEYTDE